ncbi:MAG: hypothetical protein ABIR04_00535 [Cypionkella sp.]
MTNLTDVQKAEVETLAAVLTAEQVADYFGIGRRTFYAMMERDEEIAARYKRGKAKAIGVIAQGLINKARAGDTASMIFFLKTQAGWRETSRIEHEHLPQGPEVHDTSARAQLAAMLDRIAERQAAAKQIEAEEVGASAARGDQGDNRS